MAHQQQKWPQEKKEKVTAHGRAGVAVSAIAERFATSRGHIYRILKEMGV
jgi:transposase-like protein